MSRKCLGLTSEADLDFASQMVQALNVLVLTSAEALALRSLLRKGVGTAEGAALFRTLYPAWCHNPASLLSMCLVAQAYEHAAELVMQFASLEITRRPLRRTGRRGARAGCWTS